MNQHKGIQRLKLHPLVHALAREQFNKPIRLEFIVLNKKNAYMDLTIRSEVKYPSYIRGPFDRLLKDLRNLVIDHINQNIMSQMRYPYK